MSNINEIQFDSSNKKILQITRFFKYMGKKWKVIQE